MQLGLANHRHSPMFARQGSRSDIAQASPGRLPQVSHRVLVPSRFFPESPRWIARQGPTDEARSLLTASKPKSSVVPEHY
jgi:hypothetical protein